MKIVYFFDQVHMAYQHNGLGLILKKATKNMVPPEGGVAIFVNKTWTGLKMLTSDGTLLYLRRPANKPINPETIKHLPYCVQGPELDYAKALDTVIRKKFEAL